MSNEIYYTNFGSPKLTEMKDKELKEWIGIVVPQFEFCYIPEGYNVAFFLTDSNEDPLRDIWKIVFFKKTINFEEKKTITLDSLDDINDIDKNLQFQIIKVIDGNFLTILDTSRELIENHREDIKKKYDIWKFFNSYI